MCPKYTNIPALLAIAHMAIISGSINFNDYFTNAQSNLLNISTYSLTPGQDSGAIITQS